MSALADLVPSAADADEALSGFMTWVAGRGISLYPAQEESLLEVFAGSHVIVNTPTGSGKSLVALGAHVAALASGRRTFYTAPIKALVSEKFFALCADLGPERVGMLTGDAAINPNAPVICATAEILANMALRDGADAAVGQVVMDEFHYYGDPQRGWAWQVPLLELSGAQFVLMSATLGDVTRIADDLERRTGRSVAVVRSATRPVPLEFEYRATPLHETIESLLAADRAPLYVVYFTQAAAVSQAQALTSAQVTTRAERDAIAAALAGFRFAPGFGTTLARLLRHGIGVHHGGMLPKYRRLVERLTQAGLLRVVVGTDTLGVGVNLPLRTVVLTGLAKYDGAGSRILRAREFRQIAGRAGRPGFDTSGLVVVQAPEHVIENAKAVEKAAGDPRRLRRIVKSTPPRGFVPWDQASFEKLTKAPPEPLVSQFHVTHSMLLEVLDRPGDGCRALARLLTENDEPRPAQRANIRRAIAMYRSLLAAGALQRLDEPDELGRRVRVTPGLQVDFALDNPLSPWVLAAVPALDAAGSTDALDVVSVVEATLDNPTPVMIAQLDRLKTETLTRLKAEGMEYEARMEVLDKLEYPKPLRDWTYDHFDTYRQVHPWAADFNIKPKSVARDLYERAMTFGEYVAHYGLSRSEGLVLRYLSDVYKGLVRTVPEDAKSEELLDVTEWLGELVRQVDSSLIDEWQRLTEATALLVEGGAAEGGAAAAEAVFEDAGPPPVTANIRAFRVMVRNAAFRRVELIARRDASGLAALEADGGWDEGRWEEALTRYFADHEAVGTGADARAGAWFWLQGTRATQVLDDPEGWHDFAVTGEIDLAASDEAGAPVWRTVSADLTAR